MPTDAKFGLIVGLAIVLLVAVVFFRKDGALPNQAPAAAVASAAEGSNRAVNNKPVEAKPTNQVVDAGK